MTKRLVTRDALERSLAGYVRPPRVHLLHKKHFLKRDGSILNSTPIYTHDTIIVISLHAGHKIGSSKLKLTLIPYTIT